MQLQTSISTSIIWPKTLFTSCPLPNCQTLRLRRSIDLNLNRHFVNFEHSFIYFLCCCLDAWMFAAISGSLRNSPYLLSCLTQILAILNVTFWCQLDGLLDPSSMAMHNCHIITICMLMDQISENMFKNQCLTVNCHIESKFWS